MIAFTVPGEPVPFARAGAHGKRRFTPRKQSDAMGAVRMFAERAVYLVPESWSKKRRATALWKSSKPDADNIAKLIKDALSTVVYVDDAQIAELTVQKVYGPIAGVTVTIEKMKDEFPPICGSKDFAFRSMPEREDEEAAS
jgi:hypothetical protein